ncbi:MAG: flagellar hook-associated protein FlgL [Eubacteriales bacterium]|nr:flagellar hook-associated protein FlgL [Eubacteriales bacterium]
MRVTNGMMISNFLSNLNRNMKTMNMYNSQLSSNRKITKISDDPVSVVTSIDIRAKIRDLDQFQRNVDDAQTWVTHVETAIMDINETIKSAYERAIQAANGVLTDGEKTAISADVKQLKEHVFQTLNSTYGSKYLFGGYNTNTAPFVMDGNGDVTYNNINLITTDPNTLPLQHLSFEVGRGLEMPVTFPGHEVAGTGEKNIMNLFDEMIDLLENDGSSEEISGMATKFQDKQNEILAMTAELGGRTNRLELISNRYGKDAINYEGVRGNIEDIDTSEVIMHFKMSEAVYNAALSIGSKVIVPSLVDFLR